MKSFALTAVLACVAFPFAPQAGDGDAVLAAVPSTPSRTWNEVYAWLGRRADAGEREAARLVLEMHRIGPRAYGQEFHATPQQLQRWQCRAQGLEPPCAALAPAA